MAKKVKENPKVDVPAKMETIKKIPSISEYNPEPELMPMREKEILSRKDQKAKKLLKGDEKRYGIDLGIGDNPTYNYGKIINPQTPDKKPDNLSQSAKNLESNDPAIAAKGFMDIKGKAPQQKVPELDSKQLMDDAKKQRKARWGDALTGFGQVMQGKTVNTDNWESEKLQRKRDTQFQEYKDITANNQKVKEVWDAKNRDELIDFLDKQKKVRDLTAREEAKLEEARAYREKKLALDAATEAKKWEVGYYNKRTSSEKANPKINLPFESEQILREMNIISGDKGGVDSRNVKRLDELIKTDPTSYNSALDLASKTKKLREQVAEKKKAYNAAIKEGDSVNAPKFQAELDQLNSQLEEYQNNIKSIISGKKPETQSTQTTLGKGSLDNL